MLPEYPKKLLYEANDRHNGPQIKVMLTKNLMFNGDELEKAEGRYTLCIGIKTLRFKSLSEIKDYEFSYLVDKHMIDEQNFNDWLIKQYLMLNLWDSKEMTCHNCLNGPLKGMSDECINCNRNKGSIDNFEFLDRSGYEV